MCLVILFAGCVGLDPDLETGEATSYGHGVTGSTRLWPNGRVPYLIDPTLPDQYRITDAIDEWETNTGIRFEPVQGGEVDYVYFRNGTDCNSDVGRSGGRQDIRLSTGKTGLEIMGSSISPSVDSYTWYADGMVSVGSVDELDLTLAQYAYEPANGKHIAQIKGIAIAKASGWVYAWYSDGTTSAGTTRDFDVHRTSATFVSSKAPDHIIEMDIGPDGRVYTWYDDRTYSIGTSTNLDFYQLPTPTYVLATGYTPLQVVGIAMDNTGDVYAYYSSLEASAGTPSNLAVHRSNFDYEMPRNCSTSAVIHEMGHAVGLKHEHQRCDRDAYVRVFEENVDQAHLADFAPQCNISYIPIGDYDLESIMHYGYDAFSINDSPTILALVPFGATQPTGEILDMSIARSSDVYTWWSDGTVTSGTSDDLELHRARYEFELPDTIAEGDYGEVIGVAISKATGNTFAWYRDDTYSIGSTSDLASVQTPRTYVFPFKVGNSGPRYTHWDVIGIDIAPDGRVYTHYRDGKMSIGDAPNLGRYQGPTLFHLDNNRNVDQVLGMAAAPSGSFYAWYSTGDVSAGTAYDLDSVRDLYDFRSRLDFYEPLDELSDGDIATVNTLYP